MALEGRGRDATAACGDCERVMTEPLMDSSHLTYTLTLEQLCHEVIAERKRQDAKWGRDFLTRNDDRWLAILTEEVGEAAQAILKGDEANLLEEVMQCAAVCFAWLELRVPMADQEGEAPTG